MSQFKEDLMFNEGCCRYYNWYEFFSGDILCSEICITNLFRFLHITQHMKNTWTIEKTQCVANMLTDHNLEYWQAGGDNKGWDGLRLAAHHGAAESLLRIPLPSASSVPHLHVARGEHGVPFIWLVPLAVTKQQIHCCMLLFTFIATYAIGFPPLLFTLNVSPFLHLYGSLLST